MKVAIIGTVPASKRVAPYDDSSWEIWTCSPGNSQGGAPPRTTRWFELHSIVDMLGVENASWCGAYFAWLNQQTFPIYMQERNTHVPNAIRFPRELLLKRWGESKARTNWFTSSIAWMMAFALHQGAKTIGIFGVDMAATEEHYSWQKAGCLRFVEIAREMGCEVQIPMESSLAQPFPLYGYAESSRHGRVSIIREMEMKERIGGIDRQRHELEMQGAFFRGALEQIAFERRTWVSGLDDAEIDEVVAEEVDVLADRAKSISCAIAGEAEAAAAFKPNGSGLLVPPAPPKAAVFPTSADFEGAAGAELLPAKPAPAARAARIRGGSSEAPSTGTQPPYSEHEDKSTSPYEQHNIRTSEAGAGSSRGPDEPVRVKYRGG